MPIVHTGSHSHSLVGHLIEQAIFSVNSNPCAFPTMISLIVCCEKGLSFLYIFHNLAPIAKV